MKTIEISDLSPGEAALSVERIAAHKSTLVSGHSFPEIHVYRDADLWIVRDGNNRVRALIEHRQAISQPIGSIPYVESDPPPRPEAPQELRNVAHYYGTGSKAFLAMPAATNDHYMTAQVEACRKIRAHAKRQSAY